MGLAQERPEEWPRSPMTEVVRQKVCAYILSWFLVIDRGRGFVSLGFLARFYPMLMTLWATTDINSDWLDCSRCGDNTTCKSFVFEAPIFKSVLIKKVN